MTARWRLLANGVAIHSDAVTHIKGARSQRQFALDTGLSERTICRLEANGATLTQALAIVGAELGAGRLQVAVYALAMIGERNDLEPAWKRTETLAGRILSGRVR